jgi:hypothetical protein
MEAGVMITSGFGLAFLIFVTCGEKSVGKPVAPNGMLSVPLMLMSRNPAARLKYLLIRLM